MRPYLIEMQSFIRQYIQIHAICDVTETAPADPDAFVGFIAASDGSVQRIVLHEVEWDDRDDDW
jgi:hypothetical protein